MGATLSHHKISKEKKMSGKLGISPMSVFSSHWKNICQYLFQNQLLPANIKNK